MRVKVVDTNVLVVANEAADHASLSCIEASIEALSRLRSSGMVALDEEYLILSEYSRHASRGGQPGLGDAFLRYLHDNLYNPNVCKLVSITPDDTGSFVEFPHDHRLASFDRSDRMFVAVARCCNPPAAILNATDTDWWEYRDALKDHGIRVEFLCPELMQRPRGT